MPAVAFVPADRWLTTASGQTRFRGTAATLTWGLVPDGTDVRNRGPSQLVALLDEHFQVADRSGDLTQRPWFDVLNEAFARWSELGGIEFVYEPHDDAAPHGQTPGELGVRGDIRLSAAPDDGLGGTLAFSQFPDGADIGLDFADVPLLLDSALNYRRLRNVLMHEIGHAFGLDHVVSSDAAFLMEPAVDLSFDGPQLDDIRGLHHLYGDRFEKTDGGAGNDSLTTAKELGLLPAGAEISLGCDAGFDSVVKWSDRDFLSITSALNPDIFAFETATPALLDVDLTPQGGRFHQGMLGAVELLIDASSSSDLGFSTLDSDGMPLVEVDQHPAGRVEMTRNLFLPAGRYFLQVAGNREVVQLYELRLSLRPAHVPEPPSISTAALFATTICCGCRRHRRSSAIAQIL